MAKSAKPKNEPVKKKPAKPAKPVKQKEKPLQPNYGWE